MMQAIKSVLFDFGGTLFDYRDLEKAERECLIHMADYLGVEATAEEILALYRQAMGKVFMAYLPRKFYLHRDLFRDAFMELLQGLGVEPHPNHYERYRVKQWELHKRDFQLRKGVPETLDRLKRGNMHLGIVSNIDEDQLSLLLEISGIEPYFDDIISSEKTGSCKPDSAIFNHALARVNCRAEEVLFVGDTPLQDISGAKKAGMKTVLIDTRERYGDSEPELTPDFIIREIPELPDLIWNG
ncbi:MAG: HAD family hydrolase [Desulfobacterales bacterium]